MFLCLYLLIFLLPEELSGFFWRKKRRRKRMKTKMTRRGKGRRGWGRGEEEKGKPPCSYLCIEVLKPVQLGAAFRWEGRVIAKYKNVMGHQGLKRHNVPRSVLNVSVGSFQFLLLQEETIYHLTKQRSINVTKPPKRPSSNTHKKLETNHRERQSPLMGHGLLCPQLLLFILTSGS